PYLLPSVAAAVIGGTSILGGVGGYTGTILGALILTVLNRLLLTLDTTEAFRQILYGLIVLALAWVYVRLTGQRGASGRPGGPAPGSGSSAPAGWPPPTPRPCGGSASTSPGSPAAPRPGPRRWPAGSAWAGGMTRSRPWSAAPPWPPSPS